MRWKMDRRSQNVQDRRGMGGAPMIAGGGGLGVLVIAVVIALLGGDPSIVLDQAARNPSPSGGQPQPTSPEEDKLADFVSVVLADTEDTWNTIFPQEFGRDYQEPDLVLFSGAVQSACGTAQAAVGPFYCPADQQVYIDLSFYQALKNDLNAPGDFAQAYVIAHEVGHHVQTLIGVSEQVQAAQRGMSQTQANELLVKQELQADCFAGVWAYNADQQRDILEPGDIDEALNAASQIGDDKLQQQQQGYVNPDSFTHGTAAQRTEWFKRGFNSGDVKQCNTFES